MHLELKLKVNSPKLPAPVAEHRGVALPILAG